MKREKKDRLVAIYDEYNHKYLLPDLILCIQAKYTVPNHGPRLVVEVDYGQR